MKIRIISAWCLILALGQSYVRYGSLNSKQLVTDIFAVGSILHQSRIGKIKLTTSKISTRNNILGKKVAGVILTILSIECWSMHKNMVISSTCPKHHQWLGIGPGCQILTLGCQVLGCHMNLGHDIIMRGWAVAAQATFSCYTSAAKLSSANLMRQCWPQGPLAGKITATAVDWARTKVLADKDTIYLATAIDWARTKVLADKGTIYLATATSRRRHLICQFSALPFYYTCVCDCEIWQFKFIFF